MKKKAWWMLLGAWRKVAAALVLSVLLLTTSPLSPVVAQPTAAKDDKAKPASIAQGQNESDPLDRVRVLLRDENKSAEQRIREALATIEEEQTKASRAKRAAPPSRGEEEVDRLLWLDEDEADVFRPFGGAWDPWRELEEMRARMDRMFQQAWRRINEQNRAARPLASRFRPMGEFEERDDAYIYRFDLPGVDKNDVKVTIENGRLTIEGKRESRVDENRQGMARREIFYGHFRRDMTLPPDADTSNAKTRLENGVLTIEVPRLKGQGTSTKRELKIL